MRGFAWFSGFGCCYCCWGGCYGDLGCIVCGSLDLRLVCFGWVLLDSYGLIVLYILRRGNHFAFCCWVCIVFWVV